MSLDTLTRSLFYLGGLSATALLVTMIAGYGHTSWFGVGLALALLLRLGGEVTYGYTWRKAHMLAR